MIAGLLDCTEGELYVDGRRVTGPQTDIGMVFQGSVLVDWRSVIGNVMLQIEMRGLRRRDYLERARALLRSVGLQDFADRHPYELSGGMQQRTAFCRALIHDPPLDLDGRAARRARCHDPRAAAQRSRALVDGDAQDVIFVTHSIEEAVAALRRSSRDLAATRPDRPPDGGAAAAAAHHGGARRRRVPPAGRRVRHIFRGYGVI